MDSDLDRIFEYKSCVVLLKDKFMKLVTEEDNFGAKKHKFVQGYLIERLPGFTDEQYEADKKEIEAAVKEMVEYEVKLAKASIETYFGTWKGLFTDEH